MSNYYEGAVAALSSVKCDASTYCHVDADAYGSINNTCAQVNISKQYCDKVYVDNVKMNLVPPIKNVIFNDPATIVYFEDGTKTVVKAMEGQAFAPDYGFMACLVKKAYGEDYHKLMWKYCWGGQEARRADKKKQKQKEK